jgi:hypothetical protein
VSLAFLNSKRKEQTIMTPFEQGKKDGAWTEARITECGFSSAEECLAHQEKVYQEEVAALPRIRATNPEYAAQQAEYLEGLITATRQSLQR